jgi:hypothetical protein
LEHAHGFGGDLRATDFRDHLVLFIISIVCSRDPLLARAWRELFPTSVKNSATLASSPEHYGAIGRDIAGIAVALSGCATFKSSIQVSHEKDRE